MDCKDFDGDTCNDLGKPVVLNGKCGVGCQVNDDCSGSKRCIDYSCQEREEE